MNVGQIIKLIGVPSNLAWLPAGHVVHGIQQVPGGATIDVQPPGGEVWAIRAVAGPAGNIAPQLVQAGTVLHVESALDGAGTNMPMWAFAGGSVVFRVPNGAGVAVLAYIGINLGQPQQGRGEPFFAAATVPHNGTVDVKPPAGRAVWLTVFGSSEYLGGLTVPHMDVSLTDGGLSATVATAQNAPWRMGRLPGGFVCTDTCWVRLRNTSGATATMGAAGVTL